MASPERGIQTPCVRNCCLDENDICLGCYRSISEIIAWGTASEAERSEILVRCRMRCEERLGKERREGA